MPLYRRFITALMLSLVLLVPACSGDDDDDGAAPPTEAPSAAAPTATPTSTAEPTAAATATPSPSPTAAGSSLADFELSATWGGPLVPQFPHDVALLDDGRIAIADLGLSEIQIFNADGALDDRWKATTTIPSIEDDAFPPAQVAFANDSLYVASALWTHLTRYDLEGNVLAEHEFTQPDVRMSDVVAGPDGRIYLVAGDRQRRSPGSPPYGLYVFDADLDLLDIWVPRERIAPLAMDFDADGIAHVLIYDDTHIDPEEHQIQPARIIRFDPENYSEDVWENPLETSIEGRFDGLLATGEGNYILVEEASDSSRDSDVTGVHVLGPDGAERAQWTLPELRAVGPPGSPGLALTASETFYITDPMNNRLLEVGLDGEIRGRIEDERSNRFAQPSGLAIGPDGNVFVADPVLGEIRQFSPTGDHIDTVQFSRRHIDPLFLNPAEIALDENGVSYIASGRLPPAEALRSVAPDGTETFIEVDELFDSSADPPFIFVPASIALGPDGLLYIGMELAPYVHAYRTTGELAFEWPAEPESHSQVFDVAAGPDNVFAFTGAQVDGQSVAALRRVDESEEIVAIFQPEQPADEAVEGAIFALPADFAVGADGAFYLLDYRQEFIVQVSPEGEELGRLDIRDDVERSFHAIVVDDAGRIYLTDLANREVLVYAPKRE